MANVTKRRRNVRAFPASSPPPDEPPAAEMETQGDPATPFDPPVAPRAPEVEQPKKPPKTLTFFQRVASIALSDWGDRAKIKVYRLQPLINRLVGSEHKFITIYGEPVTEEKLKIDHGSGRYRLYLNYKNAGSSKEAEMDMVEIDILDPAFPPKIPAGEWLDDPRNKQWAWARPANFNQQQNGQPQTTPSTDPLSHFTTFMDIQDRIEARLEPNAPPVATAPVQVDPWAAAEKILNMRADNPMMAILQQQMKDNAASQEAERQRAFQAQEAARQREFELQKQLLEAKYSGSAAAPPKTLAEQLAEFAVLADNPIVKKFTGLGGVAETASRGRTGLLDLARDFLGGPAGEHVGRGLGIFLGALPGFFKPAQQPNPGQPQPIVLNQQQSNGTIQQPEDTVQRVTRIGQTVTAPMLYEYFLKGMSGSDWAETMFDMWPDDYAFMRALGPDYILNAYRQVPEAWALIRPKEAAFITFMQEFCTWDPNTDEGPAPGEDDGINDLTGGGEPS